MFFNKYAPILGYPLSSGVGTLQLTIRTTNHLHQWMLRGVVLRWIFWVPLARFAEKIDQCGRCSLAKCSKSIEIWSRGRRWKKLVTVENIHVLAKLFRCCVGVCKKSLFERPNFGVGQSILRVLGAWSGH